MQRNPVTPTSGGAAAFSGCVIEGPTATYTLSATDTSDGLVVATSSPFAITAGPATQLAFVQQPTATTAGSAVAPAVSVAIEDAFGNVETSDDSTEVGLVLGANPATGTLSGGSPVVVSAGVATFSTLSIDNPGNGYTLVAGAGLLAPATSSAFNVVGPATQVVFVQGPTDATAGSTITPPVTVAVEDANGNVETADNSTQVTLAVGTNPNHGTLIGGAATTVVDGVATFSGLSIDAAGTGYTLVATDGTYVTSATSSTFDITPGSATQLAFVQQPTNTAAGSSITPAVTVAVEDAYGNVETVDNSTQVSLPSVPTREAGRSTVVAATTVVNRRGDVLRPLARHGRQSLHPDGYRCDGHIGHIFELRYHAGPSTQLAFVQEPTGAGAGSAIAPSVTVATRTRRQRRDIATTAPRSALTLGTDPGNGPLAGGGATTWWQGWRRSPV